MSVVRWIPQEDGKISQVYIYNTGDGFECLSSIDHKRDFKTKTCEEMINKLKEEFQDHQIPEFVFDVNSYRWER